MLVQNEFGSVYGRGGEGAEGFTAEITEAIEREFEERLQEAIREVDADSIAISAHKIHGPKGSGALVTKEALPLKPLVFGGGQQGGRRPGTENVAGIVGLGLAARMADELLGGTRSSTARCRAVIGRRRSDPRRGSSCRARRRSRCRRRSSPSSPACRQVR
jgi:hypothetical protein